VTNKRFPQGQGIGIAQKSLLPVWNPGNELTPYNNHIPFIVESFEAAAMEQYSNSRGRQ
jgi:hypothetical protein